jgi:hypothetical protein
VQTLPAFRSSSLASVNVAVLVEAIACGGLRQERSSLYSDE